MSSEMIEILLNQLERLFSDLIDRDLLVAAEKGHPPAALMATLEEFGLADALAVAPEDGGLSFSDAAQLFTLFGHHAVPLPLGETMLARALLTRAGVVPPAGSIGLVDGGAGPQSVAHGSDVDHLVVAKDRRLLLFRTSAAQATVQLSISREPRALLDLAQATAIADAAWPNGMPDALTLGAMLRSSQTAGVIGRLLGMSVDYANTRQQFGRPIGRFQAVQQLLAKLAAESAAAQSAADAAWAALEGGALGYVGMIAKIRTGEAARAATAIAHQVHGAIGVTDEHMLHYYTRRLWEWRLDFGSDGFWAERLGRLIRGDPDNLWNLLTTRCAAPATDEVFA